MSDLRITEVEVVKELPDYKGKGAKVYRYTVDGDDRKPEDFVMAGSSPRKVGDTIPGIEDSEYGPKVKRAQRGGGSNFKKSPEEIKRIVRQHSQEMALRLCALTGGVPDEATFRDYINWFDDDTFARTKVGLQHSTHRFPTTSDVPGDLSDLEPASADALFDPSGAD